jgi:RNA polymerase sigma-70 factor (ECF subfamily)
MAAELNEANTGGQFSTTHWSVVLQAGQAASPQRAAALERLCRAYWQPIYFFARRKGWSEEDAKDLTQQFFALLLERDDFANLNPAKGKFRTFLLTAFTHFQANEYDRLNALKRGGKQTILSLDAFLADDWEDSATAEASPVGAFDLLWARKIVETALHNLKEEMRAAGKPTQFEVLKEFLTANANDERYAAAAQTLGINASAVPMQVSRLRRRYRELVRDEVAQTVSSPVELQEEMRHLFDLLNR